QNDQHGGQSIANFDYGLAPGVAKTYKKRYRSNLTSLIEVMDCAAHAKKTKEIFQTLTAENLIPTLDGSQAYTEREKELLLEAGVPEEILDKIQSFSAKKATEETDKATYQAMEALLHNLNTMHSRAGAQTPFSSINY
ncbi:MAG TPA: anaerobic ribonucleoside triphosphate reductase, partial [Tyzzerella sp.]|nr:anaerobic ribonucleoside triphosphate reductase [Tyzzerella sp.]